MSTVKNCKVCNVQFSKPSKKAYWQWELQQFCSKSCKGKVQGFQRNKPQEKTCTYCEVTYFRYGQQKLEWWKNSKYCSQLCYQTYRSLVAIRHAYRGTQNKKWRKQILERDAYRCRISNGECSGTLEVHHILRYTLYPELRYDVNNGITLCHKHHPRSRSKEDQMIPVFKEMIYGTSK